MGWLATPLALEVLFEIPLGSGFAITPLARHNIHRPPRAAADIGGHQHAAGDQIYSIDILSSRRLRGVLLPMPRSFKNRFEHILLDRHVGAELLEYLLTDGPLTFNHPADPDLVALSEAAGAHELIMVNELLVRGNLPAATREVQQRTHL